MSAEEDFIEEITEPCSEGSGVTLDDFVAYMPGGTFIFMPCREPWPATSVDARLPPVRARARQKRQAETPPG
jgi:hypothetical protein